MTTSARNKPQALRAELTRLRGELQAMTEERDRLREALTKSGHALKETAEFMADQFYEGKMEHEAKGTMADANEAFEALSVSKD